MSKLTELLDELCPDGVEFAPFLDVVDVLNGAAFSSKQFNTAGEGLPLIRIRDVLRGRSETYYRGKYEDRYLVNPGDILIGMDGNFHVGRWGTEVALLNQRVCKVESKDDQQLLNGFLYYFAQPYFKALESSIPSGTVKHLSMVKMKSIFIPVPPLEVQQEIVRVLDAFTDLEQSLVSELELRKKQFASVLDEQVYSATLMEPKGHLVKLGEVAHYTTDRVDSEKLENSQFVGVDNLLPNLSGVRSSTYGPNTKRVAAFEAGDILLGNIRPYLRKMWLSDRSGGCSGDVLPIRINESHSDLVDPKYLYFALASDRFFDFNMQHARGGKMPRGNKSMILEYNFPMPTLETQLEVANRLNALESLIQSIEQEISLRRQQYEFYRDELLSFAPKED